MFRLFLVTAGQPKYIAKKRVHASLPCNILNFTVEPKCRLQDLDRLRKILQLTMGDSDHCDAFGLSRFISYPSIKRDCFLEPNDSLEVFTP